MIDVTRLQVLVALHEQGTLHAAAARLHVSPSAASQQLATLSREVGAPLTEADGRRLRLTDAGRALVDHAYQVLAQLERAQGDVLAAQHGELGRLTVGAFASSIASLLVPATRRVTERHPRLRVDVREVKVPDCLGELASGALDLVVDVDADGAPAADDPRYARFAIGTERVDLVLPSGHQLATSDAVQLGELEQEDWVSTIEGDSCDQLLARACAAAGFRPQVRHRAGDWMAILALVAAGMGVALVPRVAQFRVPADVAAVPVAGSEACRHLYAAVRRGSEARPAVAAYLAALREVSQAPSTATADSPPSATAMPDA